MIALVVYLNGVVIVGAVNVQRLRQPANGVDDG